MSRLQFQRPQRIAHNFKEINRLYSNMAPTNSYQAFISSQPSKPYDPLPGGHQKDQHDRHIDTTRHQAAVPQNLAGKPYQPIPNRR